MFDQNRIFIQTVLECILQGRQYTVNVPGIIENRTAVPSTGDNCVEYYSISIRSMYELIGALASMCHDMACFPQF